LGPDRHPRPAGAESKLSQEERTVAIPPAVAAFDDWLQRYATASPEARPALEAEGQRLMTGRREAIAGLIASDPESAILLTPPPPQRAIPPPKLRDGLEQIVSGEGFYGVKAICNHGPEAEHGPGCRIEHEVFIDQKSYQAKIYGTRTARLTEESASIYGVALDGVLALHQDDIVVLPADAVVAGAPSDQLALIYRGKPTVVPANELEARVRALSQP